MATGSLALGRTWPCTDLCPQSSNQYPLPLPTPEVTGQGTLLHSGVFKLLWLALCFAYMLVASRRAYLPFTQTSRPGSLGNGSAMLQVSLSADLSCGSIAPRVLTNSAFQRPTTAMRKGNSLYAVSAKFDVPEEDWPSTSYEIARVDRDGGDLMCSVAA